MCGRYHVDSEEDIIEMREIIEEINRKHNGTEAQAQMKTGEIYPTNIAPVITQDGATPMRWGFPMQGKSQTIINARSETAFEKPMFRNALMTRRLVVPTTGFYEWTHEGKKTKDKFLFRLSDEPMLYLAGIYTVFNLPTGAEARFSILTTAANDSMRPFHDRMPVCIGHSECNAWINNRDATGDIIHRVPRLLTPTSTCLQTQEQMYMFS